MVHLIYTCVCLDPKYVQMVEVLLQSIEKYASDPSQLEFLVISDNACLSTLESSTILKKIASIPIKIANAPSMKCETIDDAYLLRYLIASYDLAKYQNVLYLDADVVFSNDPLKLVGMWLSSQTMYVKPEVMFPINSQYHTKLLLPPSHVATLTKKGTTFGLNAGTFMFKNTPEMVAIMQEMFQWIRQTYNDIGRFCDQTHFNLYVTQYMPAFDQTILQNAICLFGRELPTSLHTIAYHVVGGTFDEKLEQMKSVMDQ